MRVWVKMQCLCECQRPEGNGHWPWREPVHKDNVIHNLSEVEAHMKTDRHPPYAETAITCTCGATIHTRSTTPNLRVAICSNCHPFFTGRQKGVDTAGRVEAFQKKYGQERPTR